MATYSEYQQQPFVTNNDFELYSSFDWNHDQSYLPSTTYSEQSYIPSTTYISVQTQPAFTHQFSDAYTLGAPVKQEVHDAASAYSPTHSAAHSFDFHHQPPVLSAPSDSGASIQSSVSSAIGSPSVHPQQHSQGWHFQQGVALNPGIAQHDVLATSGFEIDPIPIMDKTCVVSSIHSKHSQGSLSSDDSNKGLCPISTCGKHFKDLKAHMITHQNERPEKCPIPTCEYHHKGFARKYDKNRHTLTHYKGTMVCGFCPGSGSAAEKSFNRADVFKRHLTSVHNVEQAPPNARRKSPSGAKRPGFGVRDVSGMCSTCGNMFANAQDFYEHLDDCVLRVVQQADPSEAVNEKLLSSVADDAAVQATMEKHLLSTTVDYDAPTKYEDDAEEDDDEDDADSGDAAEDDNTLDGTYGSRSSSSSTLKNGKPVPNTRNSKPSTNPS
ncbi:hypothetical protein B0A48_06500 [Cryoendolithus antarcticus]|uniref:C2H2-type domain-containing protein n=1 Tax=Cryoendolithus antarcticus TaxID=1507870 RepID=A0A1V8TB87_9PEZI|nr:hypothetical protein B0A48_06500 [Cryoendolithus antarcticus]